MLHLEIDTPSGHDCYAMVISLRGGLDIVLLDIVEDEQEQSVFSDKYQIEAACKYVLDHYLSDSIFGECLWYTAELINDEYKIKEFSIQLETKLLSSKNNVHFYKWRDEDAEVNERLSQHLKVFDY